MKHHGFLRFTGLLCTCGLLGGLFAGPAAAETLPPAPQEGRALVCLRGTGNALTARARSDLQWEGLLEVSGQDAAGAASTPNSLQNGQDSLQTLALVTSSAMSTAELIDVLRAKDDVVFAEEDSIITANAGTGPVAARSDLPLAATGFTPATRESAEPATPESAEQMPAPAMFPLFSEQGATAQNLFPYQWALDSTTGFAEVLPGLDVGNSGPDRLTGSEEVVIAVVDGGIDYENPGIAPRMLDLRGYGSLCADTGCSQYGYNAVTQDHAYTNATATDHGTHCAGIIGADGSVGGTEGVMDAVSLVSVDVFNGGTECYTSDILRAFAWMITAKTNYAVNLRACNCSFGGSVGSLAYRMGTQEMVNSGILSVYASGNDALDLDVSHASNVDNLLPGVLQVNSMTSFGVESSFSNHGAATTDLYAPGSGIFSTVRAASPVFNDFTPTGKDSALVYEGFEEEGTAADADVGGGLVFHLYDGTKDDRLGAELSVSSAHFLGEQSLDISGGGATYLNIISEPIDLSAQIEALGSDVPVYLGAALRTEGGSGASLFPAVATTDGKFTWLTDADYTVGVHPGEWGSPTDLSAQILPANTDYTRFQLLFQVAYSSPTATYLDSVGVGTATEPYAFMSGTSMAAPAVTGALGLLCAAYPEEAPQRLAARLVGGTTDTEAFAGRCRSGGYLTIEKAANDPDPFIQECRADGDEIQLQGWFIGADAGTVTVGGQPATVRTWVPDDAQNIGLVCVETPADLAPGTVEVTLTRGDATASATGSVRLPPAADYTEFPLPQGNGYDQTLTCLLAADQNTLYLCGNAEGEGKELFHVFWQCDVPTGTWQYLPGATLSSERADTVDNIVAYRGALYATGSFTLAGTQSVGFLARYDPAAGSWQMLDTPENFPVGAAAVAYGDRLLLVGGRVYDTDESVDTVLDYDVDAKTMTLLATLPKAIAHPTVSLAGDHSLLVCDSESATTALTDLYLLDLTGAAATRTLPLPEHDPRQSVDITLLPTLDGALLTGLVSTAGGQYLDNWNLDAATGGWTPAAKMVNPGKANYAYGVRSGCELYIWGKDTQGDFIHVLTDETRAARYAEIDALIQDACTALEKNDGHIEETYKDVMGAADALDANSRLDFAAQLAALEAKIAEQTTANHNAALDGTALSVAAVKGSVLPADTKLLFTHSANAATSRALAAAALPGYEAVAVYNISLQNPPKEPPAGGYALSLNRDLSAYDATDILMAHVHDDTVEKISTAYDPDNQILDFASGAFSDFVLLAKPIAVNTPTPAATPTATPAPTGTPAVTPTATPAVTSVPGTGGTGHSGGTPTAATAQPVQAVPAPQAAPAKATAQNTIPATGDESSPAATVMLMLSAFCLSSYAAKRAKRVQK